jgi:hypothetical protein
MKTYYLKLFAVAMAAQLSCQLTAQIMTKNAPTYPVTRQDPSVSDDYHGTKVADPYRWLEDDNAAETKDWVKKQNEVTFGYLEKIPFREAVKTKLTTLWNYEKLVRRSKKVTNIIFIATLVCKINPFCTFKTTSKRPPQYFSIQMTCRKKERWLWARWRSTKRAIWRRISWLKRVRIGKRFT